jgi:diguanylate cyclase (GGDEF)-like protein
MADRTRILEGQLTVSEVMSRELVQVPLGTPLSDVAAILTQGYTQHVLVTDSHGALVGVVWDRDLLRVMAQPQKEGVASWEGKTVEWVMVTKFVSSSPDACAEELAPVLVNGAIQCLPILEGGKLVGVMTPGDLLLSWNRLHPVLEQIGTDPLTGLANRATFDRRLAEEIARASRQSISLGLILFDVDYFKQINDTCGHLTGDAVLRMVAGCLRRHLREYDVIARFGGDEFAAICSACGCKDIEAPIRRVQAAIRTLSVPWGTKHRGITLSIGTAVVPDHRRQVTSAELIHAADACLYRAKASGRDRACSEELAGAVACAVPTP